MTSRCHSRSLGVDGITLPKEGPGPREPAVRAMPPTHCANSLGSSLAQHQGRWQSYTPRLLCSPTCWNRSPFGERFDSSGSKDGWLPAAPLCARVGLQAAACFPSTQGLHQTRQGPWAAWFPTWPGQGFWHACIRIPHSAPLRRGPQC